MNSEITGTHVNSCDASDSNAQGSGMACMYLAHHKRFRCRNCPLSEMTHQGCYKHAQNSKAPVVQGYSYMQTVFLTPLMFGVAHIHHLVELVHIQGVQLTTAVAMASVLIFACLSFGDCLRLLATSHAMCCQGCSWVIQNPASFTACLVAS